MKEDKVIYVLKLNTDDGQEFRPREYQLYPSKVTRDRNICKRYDTRDVGCQYEIIRNNLIYTCNNDVLFRRPELGYFGFPKQIYAYHGLRNYTDIGVGSVKTLIRKKVKKIYLPETQDRGVGSSDLSSLIMRKSRQPNFNSFYDYKKTSSKCVGGIVEYNTGCVINKKLSPLIKKNSNGTSPIALNDNKHQEIGSNTVIKLATTNNTPIEFENDKNQKKETKLKEKRSVKAHDAPKKKTKLIPVAKSVDINNKEGDRDYSSDSLVQHVHNLEDLSEIKPSRISIDVMENKLETEYRNIFLIKSKEEKLNNVKTSSDIKSTSILKRRFEALRHGLSKKEDAKQYATIGIKGSSQMSRPSHKDVSVTSDPPSLEAHSFSNTGVDSPFPSNRPHDKTGYNRRATHIASVSSRRNRDNLQWEGLDTEDSEIQGVKGMFKLWGKKFNLEEESQRNDRKPKTSICISKKSNKDIKQASPCLEEKKEGRKFFFFKKKNKDKTKLYKNKKDITAGRCEVRDGLMIKIGTSEEKKLITDVHREIIPENYNEILRKAWFKKYLTQTIESRNSVKVRWNNNTYATSSSTVFELMDNFYKEAGVLTKSRSEMTVTESYHYKTYNTKHHVNFAQQNIEAWMVPKTVTNSPKELPVKIKLKSSNEERDNIEIRISDHKWFIDKSRAFSHQIEVILHSQNFVKLDKKESSEYLTIDIPTGFFINCSNENYTHKLSSEEVYNIIEYETESDKQNKLDGASNIETDCQDPNNIEGTVNINTSEEIQSQVLDTVLKTPSVNRDAITQGSHVSQKRCDIVGVGIITHTPRDLRDIKKPVLKIHDETSDDDSEHVLRSNHKKYEFAESYLQEYYKHWTPLGIDFFSWCVSDSHLNCCLETSKTSLNNQGGVTKSCPNIFNNFQPTTILSSCDTSSCSHFIAYVDDDKINEKAFNIRRNKNDVTGTRVLPKDSIEVYKRRMYYAISNKSKWTCSDNEPCSVPSNESRRAQNYSPSKNIKPCWKIPEKAPKQTKTCKKHVSMPNCELIREAHEKLLEDVPGILAFKGSRGCSTCKTSNSALKTVKVDTCNSFEIPQPPCKLACDDMKQSPCDLSPVKKLSPADTCSSPKLSCTPPRTPSPPKMPCSSPKTACSPPKIPCLPPKMPCTPPKSSCSPPKMPCPPPKRSCSPPKMPCSPPKRSCSPPKVPSPPPKRSCSPPKMPCPSPKKSFSPPKIPCPPKKPCPPQKISCPPPKMPCHPPKTPCPPPKVPCPPPKMPCPPPKIPCSPPKTPSPPPKMQCPPPKMSCPPPKMACNPKMPRSPPKTCPPPKLPCTPPKMPCSPPKSPCSSGSNSNSSCPNVVIKVSNNPGQCIPKKPSCPHKYHGLPCPPPQTCSPNLSPVASKSNCSPKKCFPFSTKKRCETPCCPKKNSQAGRYQNKKNCPHRCTPPIKSPCLPRLPVPPISQPKWCPNCKSRTNYIPIGPAPPQKRGLKNFFSCGRLFGWKKGSAEAKVKRSKSEPQSSVQCEDCIDNSEEKFPWPINNQVSNQSLFTGTTNNVSVPNENIWFYSPKGSIRSICLIKIDNKGSCNDQNVSPTCIESPGVSSSLIRNISLPRQKKSRSSKTKISGIHLKVIPTNKKTSYKHVSAEKTEDEGCCIRLSSNENMTIRMKAQTASTEEIREGLNIKVQDDDGQTLYERKDYVQPCQTRRPSVLGELYNSNINIHSVHRVPAHVVGEAMTSNNCCNDDIKEEKSETSVANFIEIQFQMRVTQGDKTTEISIANDAVKDVNAQKKDMYNNNIPEEVYVVKNEQDTCTENKDTKNDINIRILIKNFKSKDKKDNNAEDYSRKISEKFHTVSTGYSNNLCNKIDDNVFSIHRATVDLTTSDEICENHGKYLKNDNYSRSISVVKSFNNIRTESTDYTNVKSNQVNEEHMINTDKEIITFVHTSDISIKPGVAPGNEKYIRDSYNTIKTENLYQQQVFTNKSDKIEKGYLSDKDDITEKTDMTEKTDHTDKDDYALKDDLTEKDELTTERDDFTEREDYTEKDDLTDNYLTEDSDAKYLKDNNCHDWTMKDLEKIYRDVREKKSFEQNYKAIVSTDTDDQDLVLEANTSNEHNTMPSIEVIIKPHTKEEKKEMLKDVFEKAHDIKGKSKTRMRQLRDMLKTILTSDSSGHENLKVKSNELAKDMTYASLKPNYFRDSDSMTNYYNLEGDSITTKESKVRPIMYPTTNCSGCSKTSEVLSSDNEAMHTECMCKTLATRLNLSQIIGGGCCCCRKTVCSKDEEVGCDIKSNERIDLNYKPEAKLVDVEIQHSKFKAHTSTDISVHSYIKSSSIKTCNVLQVEEIMANVVKTEVQRTTKTYNKNIQECTMKMISNSNILTISDENDPVTDSKLTNTKLKPEVGVIPLMKPSDVLQSFDAKKAVLEIYSKKTTSDNGEHLVAKLPKFVYDRESEIRMNYQAIASNTYKSVCKNNGLTMSVKR